ncbi:hypothetical protein [Cupriavidus sp. RAF12]|uniref:hypothetical protein n=1 Tax=Cupriavidus sp. RAF12 TaxID=3233050 RepID=UPI003F8FF463
MDLQSGTGLRPELFPSLDAEMLDRLSCVDGVLQPFWQSANAIPAVAIGVPKSNDAHGRASGDAERRETARRQAVALTG